MIFLINDDEYKDISFKIVNNQSLYTKIWQKISFVEKYIDKVDSVFFEETERKIVYLELGTMVYSCFEAILKSVLFKMFECCEKRACKEKCGYRPCKTLKCLNNYPAIDTFRTLLNAELIRFSPREANELEMLNDLRNNIHLSKAISDDAPDYEFDKEFVKRMLSYYYSLLSQFGLSQFAYEEIGVCLREERNNTIESNKKHNEITKKEFHNLSVIAILRMLFLKCKLFKNEEWILKTLHKSKSIDSSTLANYIYYTFYLNRHIYRTKTEFIKANEDFFKSLSKYTKEDYMNNVVAEYNRVRELREENIMKFLRCKVCGKIVALVNDCSSCPTKCCGEPMEEIPVNTQDGAHEKHLPVYEVVDNIVKVKVGSVEHPMLEAHYIQWIALETNKGNQRKVLKPGQAPEAEFALLPGEQVIAVYEYCNLHGLYKA